LTLGINNLANIVILPAILIGTFNFAPGLVFGKILPGLSLTLLVGMITFAYFARKLAQLPSATCSWRSFSASFI
jgi:AGZA family xanthine/uracil permease-like MFS transporter